jgi:hypothetical protein
VRPKSIAREMYEGFASFADYVRSLGLERSEGVLLRYLSQVWKTMTETVPAPARTDEVMDILAHFRVLVREIDSSLLEEWESLKQPGARAKRAAAAVRPAVDVAAERRATMAGVRAEVHRLVRALAARDYETAARLVTAGEGETWTPERIAEAMARYWAEHAALSTTPDARRSDRTRTDEVGPGRFRVQQVLVDAEGDEDWSLHLLVDVEEERPEGSPRLELARIGV